jgi:hypothetical protein
MAAILVALEKPKELERRAQDAADFQVIKER